MDTLTIELMSNRALPLLQELENLNIIRLIKPKKEQVIKEPDVIKELFELQGAMQLDKEHYDEYQAFVKQVRNEWRR